MLVWNISFKNFPLIGIIFTVILSLGDIYLIGKFLFGKEHAKYYGYLHFFRM